METSIRKEVKQLKLQDARRKMFDKIRTTLNPSSKISSFFRIDVPSCHTNSPIPEGPDPKLWKGPWKFITNPTDITRHVSAANHRQYGQAKDTPFGSEPLLPLYGYNADTPEADDLIEGHLPPPSILDNLYLETAAILSSLARPSPHRLAAPTAEIHKINLLTRTKP
jgi:hypothetical protein